MDKPGSFLATRCTGWTEDDNENYDSNNSNDNFVEIKSPINWTYDIIS